jgi:hypothetical protein
MLLSSGALQSIIHSQVWRQLLLLLLLPILLLLLLLPKLLLLLLPILLLLLLLLILLLLLPKLLLLLLLPILLLLLPKLLLLLLPILLLPGDSSQKLRRLGRELRDLRGKTKLPIAAAASCFVRQDHERLDKVGSMTDPAVLCCAVLCCAVLCCAVLCCADFFHRQMSQAQ